MYEVGANSYSSIEEVTAFSRQMIPPEGEFGEETIPTLAEVVNFIDQVSSLLNVQIASVGITIPISDTTIKPSIDLWVALKVAALIELTQANTGFDGSEDSRHQAFYDLMGEAKEFVMDNYDGWVQIGIDQDEVSSDGLAFTALNLHKLRSDPTSDVLEQPIFRRHQWESV